MVYVWLSYEKTMQSEFCIPILPKVITTLQPCWNEKMSQHFSEFQTAACENGSLHQLLWRWNWGPDKRYIQRMTNMICLWTSKINSSINLVVKLLSDNWTDVWRVLNVVYYLAIEINHLPFSVGVFSMPVPNNGAMYQ